MRHIRVSFSMGQLFWFMFLNAMFCVSGFCLLLHSRSHYQKAAEQHEKAHKIYTDVIKQMQLYADFNQGCVNRVKRVEAYLDSLITHESLKEAATREQSERE